MPAEIPTTIQRAYAAFEPDGRINILSLRTSIEECCYDAQTPDVAEVEIRVVKRYESDAE